MDLLPVVHYLPFLPLAAAVTVLLLGREGPESKLPLLGVTAMAACLVCSCVLFYQGLTGQLDLPYGASVSWFSFGDYEMPLGVLIDGPAVAMLFVVSLVSLLVHVYSFGYMRGDPRFKRYFAYLSFFSAAMLGLVVVSNLMLFFLCWELVGVSSYLLIGFWFEKPGPAYACKKAFLTTKLGDLGFFVGLLVLFAGSGTFDLQMLAERVAMGPRYFPPETAALVAILFFAGAAGKSAQVPLFIWLPDAMEGPTPVSALIHAATMVAAGVYLVARTYFIFAAAPLAMDLVAWAGVLTALLGAAMALVPYDIKRVLAFSTISQLGFMMLALGAGSLYAGMFHLTTHAFFKALLFLGAGCVIHGVHSNDMRVMGGLSKRMPSTFLTMAVATLAITGFPFLSGWFSKEAVLHAVYARSPWLWGTAWFTAGLTTFYMFRMLQLTFLGASRDHHRWEHAEEAPPVMTVPLWILALLAAGSGLVLDYNGLFERLVHFDLEGGGPLAAAAAPAWLGPAALGLFVAAAYAALWLYRGDELGADTALRGRLPGLVRVLERRCYFDDFFLACVACSDRLARLCARFDDEVVDAVFVDSWGGLTRALAASQRFFDDFFVDGAVDGTGEAVRDLGARLRRVMTGRVQEYMLYMALAVALFAIFLQTR
ncbi:MAG: NADH-quinone oxidoreductase subunit L [Elusimicrobiota bacterium]